MSLLHSQRSPVVPTLHSHGMEATKLGQMSLIHQIRTCEREAYSKSCVDSGNHADSDEEGGEGSLVASSRPGSIGRGDAHIWSGFQTPTTTATPTWPHPHPIAASLLLVGRGMCYYYANRAKRERLATPRFSASASRECECHRTGWGICCLGSLPRC